MRRIILAVCATAAALVLLLSFKSHTQSPAAGSSPAAAFGTPSPGTGTPAPAGSAAAGAVPGSGASGSVSGSGAAGGPAANGGAVTVTGAAWPTIYGPVQVRVTVSGGKITAATATEYPTETPRDSQINAFAVPQLNSETVAAGSAQIDTVSGATYTSQGYIGSLQSALDKVKGA